MIVKRALNLALCFILVLSPMTQADQLSFGFPEPSFQDRQAVVARSEQLFKKGGLARHYLSRAGTISKEFALNRAHSAAIGGVQTVLVGGVSMLLISTQIACEQKKIKNEQDCLNSDVVLRNFAVAAEYMAASGEFYSGILGGGIAATLVIDAVNYLLKNAQGVGFLKSFLIGAVQSTVMFFGFSFGMQLWKESMNYLTDEDRVLAHGLLPRLALEPLNSNFNQLELSANDRELFNKIVKIMTELLFKSPELREMVIYNWWRLEVATGRGVITVASAMPAFMYMLHGMRTGSAMGPKGLVIGGALGLLGGLAAAFVPEEYARTITLGIQNLRSWNRESNLYVNGTELKRILDYYQKDALVNYTDESKNKYREKDFTGFLANRSALRNDFGTVVYERVFSAQTLIDELERNQLIAKTILSDLELRNSLAQSLAVNKEGEYQRELLRLTPLKITELKDFIKKEITVIYDFYNKESTVLGDLSVRYYGVASPSLILDLSNESAKAKELRDKNKNIIYAFVMGESKNKQEQLDYLKASADLVTFFREHSYREELLLSTEK